MYKQNDIARMNTTLAEMVAQAEKLARITADEGVALRDAEIDEINRCVKSKQEVVNSLVVIDNRFRQCLAHMGYLENDAIDNFLNRFDQEKKLAHDWQRYINIMKRCDQLNQQNSALVNVGLRHTQQAIDFLRSCVGEYVEPAVYGPKQQRASSTSCMIAKA